MRALEHSAWHGEYLGYKPLKKLLKRLVEEHAAAAPAARAASDDDGAEQEHAALRARSEGAFVAALLQELSKVSAFHAATSADLQRRLGHCAAAAEDVLSGAARPNGPLEGDVLFHAEVLLGISASLGSAELSARRQRRAHALAAIEALRCELDALLSFCAVNALAVSKILKKHDKQTRHMRFERLAAPLGERALGEPFASALVARLRTTAQCLADEVGAALHGRAISAEGYGCALCAGTLRQPVVLSCAHRFCLSCLSTADGERPAGVCPLCAAAVNPREAPRMSDVDRALSDFVRRHFAPPPPPPRAPGPARRGSIRTRPPAGAPRAAARTPVRPQLRRASSSATSSGAAWARRPRLRMRRRRARAR